MARNSDISADLAESRERLARAIRRGRSARWQLRLWSRFIKTRDEYRCLCCGRSDDVQAHHIVRRTRFPEGALDTGNGITLCRACHSMVHAEFNRRPDFTLPMSAAQGDDQDEWSFLFGLLMDDAGDRRLEQDDAYFVSELLLNFSASYQGYIHLLDALASGEMSRIRLMHEIWRPLPETFYENLARGLGEELLAAQLSSQGRAP